MPPHLTLAITPGLKLIGSDGFGIIQSVKDNSAGLNGAGFVLSKRLFDGGYYILIASMDADNEQIAYFTILTNMYVDLMENINGSDGKWQTVPLSFTSIDKYLVFSPGEIKIFKCRPLNIAGK